MAASKPHERPADSHYDAVPEHGRQILVHARGPLDEVDLHAASTASSKNSHAATIQPSLKWFGSLMSYKFEQARWVLAFDSDCGSCRRLSIRIASACDGKLDTLPLGSTQVVQWRAEAFDVEPPWEPTLIRVGTSDVKAWTGRSMVVPLVRHLGIRSSIAVTSALGTLRNELDAVPSDDRDQKGLTRKRFLQLGAGAMIAGTLVATGQTPAYASSPARAWTKANRGSLPTAYEDFSTYPLDYRREIYGELTPETRSKLWIEQLQQYRAEHPDMSVEQQELLNQGIATVSNPENLAVIKASPTPADELFDKRVKAAFGTAEASNLFATLGPAASPDATALAPLCSCSVVSSYCFGISACRPADCLPNNQGCGTFNQYRCDGRCPF